MGGGEVRHARPPTCRRLRLRCLSDVLTESSPACCDIGRRLPANGAPEAPASQRLQPSQTQGSSDLTRCRALARAPPLSPRSCSHRVMTRFWVHFALFLLAQHTTTPGARSPGPAHDMQRCLTQGGRQHLLKSNTGCRQLVAKPVGERRRCGGAFAAGATAARHPRLHAPHTRCVAPVLVAAWRVRAQRRLQPPATSTLQVLGTHHQQQHAAHPHTSACPAPPLAHTGTSAAGCWVHRHCCSAAAGTPWQPPPAAPTQRQRRRPRRRTCSPAAWWIAYGARCGAC